MEWCDGMVWVGLPEIDVSEVLVPGEGVDVQGVYLRAVHGELLQLGVEGEGHHVDVGGLASHHKGLRNEELNEINKLWNSFLPF